MNSNFRRVTATLLIFTMAALSWPPPAMAGLIPSDAAGARDRVVSALTRSEVRARLQAYGAQPGEVQARIDALNEDEVAQLAERLDSLPAGGDGIVGAIVLVFLVLLLTDIIGVTKVFPFTRSIK